MNASSLIGLLGWLTWLVAVGALLAVGAALTGYWRLAKRAAQTSVLGAVTYPPLIALAFGNIASADASSKATMYAMGLSAALNCSALGLLAAIAAAVVWIACVRRERKQRRSRASST